ncbi:MAG: hypothetical protein KIT72_11205 [Polyangiaceae bacterium]|nr:hypothetical protein [Polyangiaceae bacterium]MCW5790979.1 hypothetical protein [Polyangiaceae bacterium]
MSRRAAAISNDPLVDQVASDAIAAGASALGACLTGFFAAAAVHDGVLMSPLGVVVGGVGVGARGFDGRLRQPGLGARRPRGFLTETEVPLAARVAIPCGLTAAAVACAYQAGTSMAKVVAPAVALAKRAKDEVRVEALKRVGRQGATVLRDPLFARPLQLLGGPPAGGSLSIDDLAPRRDLDQPLRPHGAHGQDYLELPWDGDAPSPEGGAWVVLAIDVSGSFAGAVFQRLTGPKLEELGVVAPLGAVPVLRGVPRVRPGSPLPAPLPIALRVTDGQIDAVVAEPGASRLSLPTLGLLRTRGRLVERLA